MEQNYERPKQSAMFKIAGCIGKKPQRHTFSSGSSVLQFSVAVNKGTKDKVTGVWDNKTSWFDCKAWKEVADQIETEATNGTYVDLEGTMELVQFTDKQGNTRQKLELTVWTVNQIANLPKRPKPANDIYESTYVANNPQSDQDVIF